MLLTRAKGETAFETLVHHGQCCTHRLTPGHLVIGLATFCYSCAVTRVKKWKNSVEDAVDENIPTGLCGAAFRLLGTFSLQGAIRQPTHVSPSHTHIHRDTHTQTDTHTHTQ